MKESTIEMNDYSTEDYRADAEAAVIAAILINNGKWDDVADIIAAEDFWHGDYAKFFNVISEQLIQRKPIDPFTLTDALITKGCYPAHENNNVQSMLFALMKNAPGVNAVSYAQSVKQASIHRQLQAVMVDIHGKITARDSQVLETAQSLIMSIGAKQSSTAKHAKEVITTVINQLEELFARDDLPGVATGFIDLDKKTHGLQNGDLVILAARPGMGKTTLAMNIVEHVSIANAQPVMVFSLEMPAEQLGKRILASRGRIDFELIRAAKCDHEDFAIKMPRVVGELSESKLFIDDSAGLSILEMRSRALRIKREHGLSLIVVDYLQLMSEKAESETVKISNISAGLKRIAKELQVPVIALSQLNRAVEQRNDKRPLMADLRQSGAIEQDADLILFLYRDEVYDESSQAKGTAEINIAKHRNGETGMFRLSFNGRYCRFDNYSGEVIPFAPKVERNQWNGGFEY